mgnify:FL=1|jgi:hypothetical protein
MPGTIKMVIDNGMPSARQIRQVQNNMEYQRKVAAFVAPRALNSSMIARIHSIKPGCGGCGRR